MKSMLTLDQHTADQLGIGIFRYQLSPRKKFISSNNTLAKIFGFSSRQALEKHPLEDLISNPKDREDFFKRLRAKGRIAFFETSSRPGKGKRPSWVAISAGMAKNGSQAKYVEGIVQDISTFKETQAHLSDEIDVLQNFLDSMPDAIYFKDAKNRITKVNKFYADGFKLPPEKIIGKTDYDFFPEDQARQMFADDNTILKTGKPIIGKIEKTLLPNGTWNQVITTKIPMVNRRGRIVGTMGVTRDMTAHANLERERFSMILSALQVLGKALEMRDPYTYSHTCFVAKIAQSIAKEMGFDEDRVMQVKLAAELHDLGKISVPLDILIKPGKLTELEFRLVREHVNHCHALIKGIQFPFPLAEIIFQHHERLDGSGYPRGLKGDQILIEARILAVSDVLESMTSHRPYREALGINRAIEELEDGAGIRYDAGVVKVAMTLIKDAQGLPFWKNTND